MQQPLIPCPSCARHVRAAETTCPFCAALLPSNLHARAIPGASVRLTRAAAFVFGATVALTDCGGTVVEPTGGGGGGAGGSASSGTTASGTTASGTTSGTESSATGGFPDAGPPDDDGGVGVLYGPPWPPQDAGPPADDGGGAALYGLPPPPDAGPKDDGGAMPLYGLPPPP